MTPVQLTKKQTLKSNGLERTRYFSRQLVTASDLTQDQDYFREKMRRHNHLLHGWGVVCGLEVTAQATNEAPWQVEINSGYALSPQGDEIYVSEPVTIDLIEHCLDPTRLSGPKPEGAYLAIRYNERPTRPVRVQPAGCACADRECEYSRLQDSFEIRVLEELPATYGFLETKGEDWVRETLVAVLPCTPDSDSELGIPRPCPPTSPVDCNWVILAWIWSEPNVNAERIKDKMIDDLGVRRYVISLGGLYLLCAHLIPSVFLMSQKTAGEVGGLGLSQIVATLLRGFAVESASSLVDLQDAADEIQPRASVVLHRVDDTPVALPAAFRVDPRETFASLVKREGNRRLYDPVENKVYRLGELYAVARVAPEAHVNNLLEALAPLEGLKIETAKLQEARIGLELLLDKRGVRHLDMKHFASPAKASMLPATDIRGVSPRSQLGKKLKDKAIGDVAGMSLEDFLALARKGVAKRRLRSVERQAKTVWDRATKAHQIAKEWRGRA